MRLCGVRLCGVRCAVRWWDAEVPGSGCPEALKPTMRGATEVEMWSAEKYISGWSDETEGRNGAMEADSS